MFLPSGSHAPVYFYEFQHRPNFLKDLKPHHVKADHGDEVFLIFGSFFWGVKSESPPFFFFHEQNEEPSLFLNDV